MKRAMILLLVLVACSPARQAERKRAKAEGLVKEAIETYPDIIQPVVQWDTITLYTKPEAGAGARTYRQASMDSILTICADLVLAERAKVEAADSALSVLRRKRLTRHVCRFDTIKVDDGVLSLVIWPDDDRVGYWYNVAPQQLDTALAISTRVISTDPCPPVKAGYTRWQVVGFAGISAIMSFVIGVAFGLFSKGYIPPEQ